MKKTELLNKATRTLHKVGFQIKKHSPEILAVTGAVGVVTSTVWACKQTTKLSGILEEGKATVDQIHQVMENPEMLPEGAEYTEQDAKKDLTIAYVQTGVKVVKLYAGPVILGTLSLTAMLTSNNILRKRNVALMTAYTALDKGYKEYRNRVVERFGKEIDRELLYNIKAKEITETVVNEDGTETEVTKVAEVADDSAVNCSPYAFFFDESCAAYTKDPETNKFLLVQVQAMLNDRLKAHGHVFLNELHDALGAKRTKQGQVVGWIYDPVCPNGDNYIDLGLWDGARERTRAFINGYERTLLIDPNVDGVIYDLI